MGNWVSDILSLLDFECRDPNHKINYHAKIYDGFNNVKDYEPPSDPYYSKTPVSVTMLTSSNKNPNDLELNMYPEFTKLLYGKKFGYKVVHRLSNQFLSSFGSEFLKVINDQ